LEHADYQDDLALYAGFAQAAGRDDGVLELACGTGRCLLPLAAAGYDITGLDRSPAMLAVAQAKVDEAGLQHRVRLVEGDMRAFALDQAYGLVFIALNSLMHLDTREEQGRAITCAGRHLAPAGRLVLDLFNPDVALPDEHSEGQLFLHCLKTLPGGGHLLHFQSPSADRARQVVSMANYYDEIAADGTVKRHVAPFTLRYLTRGELELLIPTCGLEVEALYGSYDLEPFQAGSPRLIAVARRPTT
ncbi:MAG: class I SAM-dependent methyltransferase, partial [Chloroflexota bacterium]